MYTPRYFAESGSEKLTSLIERNALGTLVVLNNDEFEINHIPFLIDSTDSGATILRAHIPRANSLSSILKNEKSCTVVFQDADGYVSPSWYATKMEHGKVVPTWNYSVVHAHGNIVVRDDPQWVITQLTDLTTRQEANRSKKWAVTDAPADYIRSQVTALVGLEVNVTRLAGKVKASQNQPAKNQATVLSSLKTEQPESRFTAMMESALGKSD